MKTMKVLRAVACAGAVCFCAAVTVQAAHVDWDGGTSETNTAAGGSANVAANWGPAGGGADGAGGAVPGQADDVFLNGVTSAEPALRQVTVDSSLTWKSLSLSQTSEPASGMTTNRLTVNTSATVFLTNAVALAAAGAANAPVSIHLNGTGVLAFAYNGASVATLGSNTLLTGGGWLTNANANVILTLNAYGALAGPGINLSSSAKNNTFVLGASATVANPQEWRVDKGGNIQYTALDNRLTVPAQWQNGVVTYTTLSGSGLNIEAATATTSPTTNSSYRFSRINLASGNLGQAHAIARFRNAVQNDGGTPGVKEAVYASSWNVQSAGDSSGGHFLVDLNGQDLYVDRFANMTSFGGKALQFLNTGTNTVSTIRALGVSGDTLLGGSFAAMNGATLEVVGGTWFDGVYNRSVGDLPADSAAVPNTAAGNTVSVDVTRLWDGIAGNSSRYHASFYH